MSCASRGEEAANASAPAIADAALFGHSRPRPAGADDQLADPLEGPFVGREYAVEPVVEDLVEGPPRNAGPPDQLADGEVGVAAFGHAVDHGVEEPLALVGQDRLMGQCVRPAGELRPVGGKLLVPLLAYPHGLN